MRITDGDNPLDATSAVSYTHLDVYKRQGCGNALTSIFLAKAFGVTVFANDLWVSPTDNWKRICNAGVENLVFPIHGEAHNLPYADNFFDAVVCINSFQFYGTADNYLSDYMAHLIKPDGQFGLVVWGPDKEFTGKVPADIGAVSYTHLLSRKKYCGWRWRSSPEMPGYGRSRHSHVWMRGCLFS